MGLIGGRGDQKENGVWLKNKKGGVIGEAGCKVLAGSDCCYKKRKHEEIDGSQIER